MFDKNIKIKDIKKKYLLNNSDIAEICSASVRTVEGWLQGRGMNEAAKKLLRMYVEGLEKKS